MLLPRTARQSINKKKRRPELNRWTACQCEVGGGRGAVRAKTKFKIQRAWPIGDASTEETWRHPWPNAPFPVTGSPRNFNLDGRMCIGQTVPACPVINIVFTLIASVMIVYSLKPIPEYPHKCTKFQYPSPRVNKSQLNADASIQGYLMLS